MTRRGAGLAAGIFGALLAAAVAAPATALTSGPTTSFAPAPATALTSGPTTSFTPAPTASTPSVAHPTIPASPASSVAQSAAVGDEDLLPVAISIDAVTPRVLEPGQDQQVRVTLTNTGSTAVAEPRVLVHLDRTPFISRYSLDQWRDAGADGAVGSVVLELDLPEPLAPGQALSLLLTVPAAEIQLPTDPSSWGGRGLAVQVVDLADPARVRLGLARTFALWFPAQVVTATGVSIVVPVTGVAVDPHGGTWADALEQLTLPGGRLGDLLAATGDHTGVTWAVDAWLAEAAADAGPLAQTWWETLVDRMAGREVLLLPYLDPDLAALAHTGATGLLQAAVDRAEAAALATDLPDDARASLAWPADPLPDLATAALADDAGRAALLVGPGELPAPGVLTYTPTGRTTVTAAGEDVTVLVPDERLSAALVSGAVGSPDEEPSGGLVTPATAAQDLLAELAVITRERPNDGRHVLLTVPRDWTPDVDIAAAQLDALAAAPWVSTEPVSALVEAEDPGIDRGTLPRSEMDPAEIDAAALGTVRNAVERRELLAGITADPAALLGDLGLEQLAPTSVAWRADLAGRARSVAASHAATEAIGRGVSVQPSGDVTLISTSGRLPVQVTNTLDQDAAVWVALRPGDGRLVADEPVEVVVPADGRAVVQIPVHAVQSGDVPVTVELRTADGTVLDDSTHFMVGVRADWEGIGAAIAGGLLAVGLVVGLIRTVRRGRTAGRVGPRTTVGPDALSPEEQAEHAGPDADVDGTDGTDAGDEPGAGTDAHDDAGPRPRAAGATALDATIPEAPPPDERDEEDAGAEPSHDPSVGPGRRAPHR